jgi:hypothetical protein
MMKSRTLAESQRVRPIGDYSVTVDRSGTSSTFHLDVCLRASSRNLVCADNYLGGGI